MSNFWLNKKKERETLNLMEDAMCCYSVGRTPPAPATKTIPVWNFEEVIKAVLDKHTLTYFAGRPDYIVSGPGADKIVIDASGIPDTINVGNAYIPDVITFGPSNLGREIPTIVEICQAKCNPELNGSIGTWELDL